MSRSKMIEIRRRKQKGKKQLAILAKRAKQLDGKNATTPGAGNMKKASA